MSRRALFLVAYAASGAAALLYEIAWARLLTLLFGHGVAAVSTVLAAFMGGLAAGAAVAGRPAMRLDRRRALSAYAAIELAIGLAALLLPAALDLARPILAATYADGSGGATFALTRLAISVGILALPTALMGATFPLAVRWYVTDDAHPGAGAGRLYAANTVGAASGAAVTAFVLLPLLGLRLTTLAGVLLNGAAALVAWRLARGESAVPAVPPPERPRRVPRGAGRPGAAPVGARPFAAAMALGLSGCVALTLEVAWTRLLALIVGPTTYAFGLLLAAFIGGLAAGSALGARLARQLRDPLGTLGAAVLVVSLGGVLVAGVAPRLPLAVARLVARPDAFFGSIIGLEALALVVLLLPTTLALGAAFPLGVAAATRDRSRAAGDAALVYAANTLGAIVGSLAAGFVLIPALGLRTTMLAAVTAAACTGVGVVLAARPSRLRRGVGLIVGAAALAIAVLLPAWNRALLSSGAYKYAPYLRSTDLRAGLEAGTLVYYAEGAAGTVTVRRATGTLSLAIDGKVDASNGSDMLTQRLLAHLPLLLHAAPRTVGIIGLGSGVTLGSALRHPLVRADVIEISPQVVEASRFFTIENHDALGDSRTRLVLGDGRTHLSLAAARYDVIISEPSNPWMAGVASLFTREFFQSVRARLAPGGLVCQWAHTYDIADRDLRSIVATFLSVFPNGSLWLVGEGDVLLVAGTEPLDGQLERLAGGWSRPEVAADLASVGVRSPFGLLSLFVAAGPALAEYAAAVPVQTDDRMALEFSAPRDMYGVATADNAVRLRDLAARAPRPAAVDRAWRGAGAAESTERGLMLLAAEAASPAFEDLARAVALAPDDGEALDGLVRAATAAGRTADALTRLAGLVDQPRGRVTARLASARLLAAQGRYDEAARTTEAALAIDPAAPPALAQLASIYADLQDASRLKPVVETLEAVAPDSGSTLYYSATLAFLEGRLQDTVALAARAAARRPEDGRVHNLLGAASATLGHHDQARREFEAAIERDPRDPTAYLNLGWLELDVANPAAASARFAEALSFDPTSAGARQGLSRALELLGDPERARALREIYLP